MFPGGSLGWIQSRIYIWEVVVCLLFYVLLLVMHLGRWLWGCHIVTSHRVLFGFCNSIALSDVSRVFK